MDRPPSRTLLRALDMLGTKERLAAALHVRPDELEAYLLGQKPVPNELFLAALDIVAGRGSMP